MRRTLAVSYLAAIASLTLILQWVDPARLESILAYGPQCPLRLWTGLKCAFCGMTHSWIALLQGHPSVAFQENLLGPLLFAASVVASIWVMVRPERWTWSRQASWILLIVLGAYAVARNLF